MKDFTEEKAPTIEFKIDGDVFYAVGDCPGGLVTDLGILAATGDTTESLRLTMEFLDKTLLPESAELFVARMRDPSNPITFKQSINVFTWLIEEYSGNARPTQAPSLSPEQLGSTGMTSTASAPSEEDSIHAPLRSVVSST